MADASVIRRMALHGASLPTRIGVVAVTDAGPMARYAYRGSPANIGAAFGVALPTQPMRAAQAGGRAALWLGPDEWLLLAPENERGEVLAAISGALGTGAASLVDISHRQVGFDVTGPGAAEALSVGCPLDLDGAVFSVGMCTRTVLAKAEIVLWRHAPGTFRLDVARSFAPYVAAFLTEATRGSG